MCAECWGKPRATPCAPGALVVLPIAEGPGQVINEAEVRQVIAKFGKLVVEVEAIGVDDDLYKLGLSSHASVNVMLGLEDTFDVEFPEHMLRKSTFRSIASICAALDELLAEQAAAQ